MCNMRPLILTPLFRSVRSLAGVGPKNAKLFEKLLGGERILDLLWHKPVDIIDRRHVVALKDATANDIITCKVVVERHEPSRRRGTPSRIKTTDGTAVLELVFFHAKGDWLEKTYPIGAQVVVSGKVEPYNNRLQMVHPDHVGAADEIDKIAVVEPIYPMTQGLGPKHLTKTMAEALPLLPDLPEWQDAPFMAQKKWPAWKDAMQALHAPQDAKALGPEHPVRARLAYDELLARALGLQLVRLKAKKKRGRVFAHDSALRGAFLRALPFALTHAQSRAIDEIDADMQKPERMLRLLQGDVGSGKTVVALATLLNAVACGAQGALMAPTEILARQHAQSLAPIISGLGLSVAVITGRDKGKARAAILERVKNGDAHIIIGTHALFSDDVIFKDLGAVVIDEQHRFGVHQRLKLSDKGIVPDVLVMTATPIPRTLTLSLYGDMDVSRLNAKPPGRKPINTLLLAGSRIGEVVEAIQRKVAEGARAYWVCPLVEESEVSDLAAATQRHADLCGHLGSDKVGLIHGQMKAADKDKVMADFAEGRLSVLVATTVIEVGVNVPEATIMVIEHAERFGLAQLHQLRGRVGRGGESSTCMLLYTAPLSEMGKERLSVMRDTEDGFIIAEKDLELRGAGEILGTRQSGLPAFRLADIDAHRDLMETAHNESRLLAQKDPTLTGKRAEALRTLLYLFSQDAAVQTLRSG